jgi:alkanesulfonate monooxygenase SsuD/methylene tetrahydromethanopterin reductase-like flavin-dependent oxidoreductase (luciferase family)
MSGFDLMLERDYLLIGSPDSVAERMIRMHGELGIEHLLLSIARAPEEDVERSMRLMAEEVMPAVRRATQTTAGMGTR